VLASLVAVAFLTSPHLKYRLTVKVLKMMGIRWSGCLERLGWIRKVKGYMLEREG